MGDCEQFSDSRAGKLASVELLAPAGGIESLRAAVCAGANAVYLGLDGFNARRNADNFTMESLSEACDYAHLRGVRVYVTVNIEVLPSEMDEALSLVRCAHEAGADAFIVQDIGLAREVARLMPSAELHASTQMNIHNAAGIAAAARLGMSRVTLARELSVAEISELCEIASELGIEIECFIHGALCICYSGQCLMSSMIGGRSANRGLCAQACRLPYELRRSDRENVLPASGEHLLSPKDLCAIDLLEDLADAGVASFKVEGRMKSPDYVHAVVSVYRQAMDHAGFVGTDQRTLLADAFSRGFTTAYLEGQRGNDIMSYSRPNNRGVFAGRVAHVAEGGASVAPEIDLHAQDVLEFWTSRGRITAVVGNPQPAKDGLVFVQVSQRVGKGDRVFRVRNAELAFEGDPFEPRIPVRGKVSLRIGKPAYVSFEANGSFGEAIGDLVDPARTRAVSSQDVKEHVDRLGNTPFALGALEIELDDNVGIGFSALHHLRAEALEELRAKILGDYSGVTRRGSTAVSGLRQAEGRPLASALFAPRSDEFADAASQSEERLTRVEPEGSSELSRGDERSVSASFSTDSAPEPQVVAFATNPSCARAAKRAGAAAIYVPLLNFRRGQAQLEGIRQEDPEQAGYPKQCVPVLPTVDHDPVYAGQGATRETLLPFDLWDYVREGKPVFADNLGDVLRALEAGAQVEVGPHVPVTNAATLQVLADLGVSRVWLSPELTLGQIADLAREADVPLGLTVAGAQELMVTEHCLLMSQGPCNEQCETCSRRSRPHLLRDRKGYDFPVITDMLGRSHLYNGVELDAVPAILDLVGIGISAVMVDTALMSKKEAESAVSRAVRALDLARREHRAVQKRQGATTGHLFRGVS